MHAEKLAIRAAFGRAARSYDAVATVQRHIADRLIMMSALEDRDLILDAGSGTGYGSRQLKTLATSLGKDIRCITLDIATEMAMSANDFGICGDIESLPLAASTIDLYWSSLAWQWVDPQLAIAEAARVLRPGGKLRVATLGPRTLHELRAAFAGNSDVSRSAAHGRRFTPHHCYQEWLSQAGFIHSEIMQETVTVFLPNLHILLSELKALGAHIVGKTRRRGLLGRHAWQCIEARYEDLRTAQGLPVTYDVVYLNAIKSTPAAATEKS